MSTATTDVIYLFAADEARVRRAIAELYSKFDADLEAEKFIDVKFDSHEADAHGKAFVRGVLTACWNARCTVHVLPIVDAFHADPSNADIGVCAYSSVDEQDEYVFMLGCPKGMARTIDGTAIDWMFTYVHGQTIEA